MLIENRCNLDLQNKYGRTALMVACGWEKIDVVQVLIDAGCDLDVKNNYDCTALMDARRWGGVDIVQMLENTKK